MTTFGKYLQEQFDDFLELVSEIKPTFSTIVSEGLKKLGDECNHVEIAILTLAVFNNSAEDRDITNGITRCINLSASKEQLTNDEREKVFPIVKEYIELLLSVQKLHPDKLPITKPSPMLMALLTSA